MPPMICCDVNVIVASLRDDHPHFQLARDALLDVARSGAAIGIPDFIVVSAIRLITNPRIFAAPTSPREAVEKLTSILAGPASLLPGSAATTARFLALVDRLGLRGNDIPDAALAAVAIENRAELLTFDRGFARFDGLRWRIPAS